MAAVVLSECGIATLKLALREYYPEVKSSHLSESIAAALGCRTHAALLARVARGRDDPPYALLSNQAFITRLIELGYPEDSELDFEYMTNAQTNLISTGSYFASEYVYVTERQRAWRALLVSGINAALERKVFSLRPGDNRWDGNSGITFDFTLHGGIPARCHVGDAGWDELAINVAAKPSLRYPDALRAWNAGFDAGEAFAFSWLQRRDGVWPQTGVKGFTCRRHLARELAAIEV